MISRVTAQLFEYVRVHIDILYFCARKKLETLAAANPHHYYVKSSSDICGHWVYIAICMTNDLEALESTSSAIWVGINSPPIVSYIGGRMVQALQEEDSFQEQERHLSVFGLLVYGQRIARTL